jgi:hypothetical protein
MVEMISILFAEVNDAEKDEIFVGVGYYDISGSYFLASTDILTIQKTDISYQLNFKPINYALVGVT